MLNNTLASWPAPTFNNEQPTGQRVEVPKTLRIIERDAEGIGRIIIWKGEVWEAPHRGWAEPRPQKHFTFLLTVHIIFSFTRGMSYIVTFYLSPTQTHYQTVTDEINFREPFSKICVNLLPVSIISFLPLATLHHFLGLRSSIPLPRPTSRTKKFQSFVNNISPLINTNHQLCDSVQTAVGLFF